MLISKFKSLENALYAVNNVREYKYDMLTHARNIFAIFVFTLGSLCTRARGNFRGKIVYTMHLVLCVHARGKIFGQKNFPTSERSKLNTDSPLIFSYAI